MFTRSFRLGLERLDDRNAPSSLFGNAVATTDWMPPSDTNPEVDLQPYSNQKPQIINFTVSVGTGKWGTFTGKVVDEAAAGLTVTLSGPQTCFTPFAATVITDANGNFSFEAQLFTGDSGIVSANTSDAQGLAATTVTYNLIV